MELELDSRSTPFDLGSTLLCGQLFRWENRGGTWRGVTHGFLLEIRQTGDVLAFEGANADFVRNYFRLDDDLPTVVSEVSRDPHIQQAIRAFPGLRLVRQDPWECLVSFICATCKSIPAIKRMVHSLSRSFGRQVNQPGLTFYTFPEPDALAAASVNELKSCGLGFRARRLREAARWVNSGEIDLEQLGKADYAGAKAELQQMPGVGSKVADCVLLFSLEKLESFPIDVRIKRVIERHYSGYFEGSFIRKISQSTSVSRHAYDRIGSFARSYFGRYAGYAQEYLYHYAGKCRQFKNPSLSERAPSLISAAL
jgi:N-glycosylase/DNA lyase